jgi:hypothetical protein
MTEYYGDSDVTSWHSVAIEPKTPGFYQVLYEGDIAELPVDMYSFRYWDGHNWRIATPDLRGSKSVFGNHQRDNVQEFWRGIKEKPHGVPIKR